ncbi:Pre-mRNA-splicing factor of RES complex-domain-containing protein [Mycena olivaceomarginata]|nr:Pre-mRNA-splicing factor of RES complex-domain-containing protein [Mycena olivaceomarginata]
MSNMKAYLAEKYMSGAKADAILAKMGPKKKKRKATTAAPSAFVMDVDGGWGDEAREDMEDAEEAAVVAADRSFKKRKVAPTEEGSGWATIQPGVKEETPPPDEQPQVVDTPFVGGLVTAQQLKKALPQTNVEPTATAEEIALAQETVYRDATGKKINTKAARAEAARLKREREEKEAQKMEWGKGLEMKAKELWNDPAAQFLTKKRAKGPRKPEYTGPTPPPNRFGIKPGYRWDGVDRGNGFEKKWFQSINQKKRKGLESYQWSAEDM